LGTKKRKGWCRNGPLLSCRRGSAKKIGDRREKSVQGAGSRRLILLQQSLGGKKRYLVEEANRIANEKEKRPLKDPTIIRRLLAQRTKIKRNGDSGEGFL